MPAAIDTVLSMIVRIEAAGLPAAVGRPAARFGATRERHPRDQRIRIAAIRELGGLVGSLPALFVWDDDTAAESTDDEAKAPAAVRAALDALPEHRGHHWRLQWVRMALEVVRDLPAGQHRDAAVLVRVSIVASRCWPLWLASRADMQRLARGSAWDEHKACEAMTAEAMTALRAIEAALDN